MHAFKNDIQVFNSVGILLFTTMLSQYIVILIYQKNYLSGLFNNKVFFDDESKEMRNLIFSFFFSKTANKFKSTQIRLKNVITKFELVKIM